MDNLFLVCVDCLRRDFVDGPYASTPFLDDLVDTGAFFDSMYATATTTTPAVASVHTGCYSETNGVHSLRNVDLDDDVTTLAEALSSAGYRTIALATGPLAPQTGLDRGFDEYHFREPDEDVFSEWFETARERLDELDEPFFVYLHLWEIHHPIETPQAFDDQTYGSTQYGRTLSAVDRKLATLAELLPPETLFALYGDHGESISTRNTYPIKALKLLRDKVRFGWGVDTRSLTEPLDQLLSRRLSRFPDHAFEDGHGQCVYDFTSNVPFIVDGPGIPAERVSEQVRQIDIFPTLLELLDVPYDAAAIDGETLVPTGDLVDRVAYTRGCGEALRGEKNWMRSVRVDDHRYVEFPNRDDWEPECYDLEADPWELDPLEEYDRPRFERAFPFTDLGEADTIDIDDRLRDLGYL